MGPAARALEFTTRDGRRGLVRVAKPSDARACLRIVAEAVSEKPRTLSILPDELWSARVWRQHRLDWSATGVTLVAEVEGRVVGQLTCAREVRSATRRHNAELGITVATAHRGLGAGRAMLHALEAWAADVGVTRLRLGVFEGNDRARVLYASMGYEEEGVERAGVRFPEGPLDVIRMSKQIAAAGRPVRARGYDEAGEERST